MLSKNKIARITLVLFMALNISVINSSIIKANPVDSSYYNPYSHGESFDKPRTFNANEESNSERKEREKREVEEAKKKAEEAKRQAQAQAEAEKAKQDASFPDASNGSEKVNHTGVLDTDTKNGIQKSKIDTSNYVNSDAYKDIAKAKCEKIAKEAVQKGSLLKANGERITDTNDICTEEALDQFTHCLAAYNAEGATPSNIDEQVLNECANNYVLVTRSTSTYDKNEVGVLDRIKESLAEGFISTFSGVLPDSIVQAGAEIIREITWKDIAEEVAITGGLMALTFFTGGAGSVDLLARGAQLLNKVRKIGNKVKVLNKAEKGVEATKNLASVEKEFVQRAKNLTGEKIENYKDAIKAIKRKAEKGKDFETKSLEKIGKQIENENEALTREINGKSSFKEEEDVLQDKIKSRNKLSNQIEVAENTKKLSTDKEEIKKITKKIDSLRVEEDYLTTTIKNEQKEIIKAKNNIDASDIKADLDATNFSQAFRNKIRNGATIIAGIGGASSVPTAKVAYREVLSNPNAPQTNTKVNTATIKQYFNESTDTSLTKEQQQHAKDEMEKLVKRGADKDAILDAVNNSKTMIQEAESRQSQRKANINTKR